jgi:exonuclease SbcC
VRFDRLRLEHFKCYESVDVAFEPGVTVIHGLNGSGKSSLLEGAFFALYGARALGKTLDEVVTIGADESVVELWFTHAGSSYRLERRLRVRDSGTQTVECVLEGPEGPFEGATDVRARVAELLRMDEDAFVNCAYVRQGEVDKLIEASPGDRQDVIDDLLQLGKLEDYRERASDARVGIGRVRDDKRGALSQVEAQIAAKEEQDLHARLNDRESTLAEVKRDIERFEAQRETAVETRERALEVLETYAEKREALTEIESDVEALRETIAETESERAELADRVQDHRDRRADLVERRDELLAESAVEAADAGETSPAALSETRATLEADLEELRQRNLALVEEKNEHEAAAEAASEAAADLAERADEKREAASDLADSVRAARETLAERRETLAERTERIAELEATFEEAPVDVGEAADWHETVTGDLEDRTGEITAIETTLENERESLAEAKDLLAAGKCPTCGQDVDGAPHVDTVDEDEARIAELEDEFSGLVDERETLAKRRDRAATLREREQELRRLRDGRENLAELLEHRESELAEKEERVETRREEASSLEAEAAEERATAEAEREAAEAVEESIAEANGDREALRERIERLDDLRETWDAIDDLDDAIERTRERRAQLEETNDERRERLAEKRERKAELADELEAASVEEARADRDRAEDYIEEVDETLADLRERRDDLQETVGGIRNEIEELEALRERREGLAATVERLGSLYDEAADLEELYGNLRADLRQRNVETLERMLNESFDLVYENDSYSHIELDGGYELTVYQKDGEPLQPDQLSGGERALFNLSLRSAVYRLLAEGIEGAAPMPPLILDEPTVFLDSGHVSRLLDLIEHMRDLGVEQLLVVSHDEELVAAADDLLSVHKDATSNRSTVERVGAAEPVPGASDD